jgi:hypothetical protein
MAVYERSCDDDNDDSPCSNKADNYGIIEISENITHWSFSAFQEMVLFQNPSPFLSVGVHTYTCITGATIQFEIDPQSEDESQIIQISLLKDSGGNEIEMMIWDRNYKNWPMVWTSNGSIQSTSAIGRWTFDTDTERYIYDVSFDDDDDDDDTRSPRRIVSFRPRFLKHNNNNDIRTNTLTQSSSLQSIRGQYFDDSESVVDNDTIQRMVFAYDAFGIIGFRMVWRKSGLQSRHGRMNDSSFLSSSSSWSLRKKRVVEYELNENECINTVGIGTTTYLGIRRVHRIRMVITSISSNRNDDTTNRTGSISTNRTIIVGYGTTEDAVYHIARTTSTTTTTTTTTTMNAMIALYGRASDEMIHQLGVVEMITMQS